MKYFLALLFLCFFLNSVSAQEKHFVFIESDTRQPFYVSLNGKIYSSSASGYVIIPKLTEGEYNATIGFAANIFPEQSFKYSVGNKDLGFSLKNFGEKGWGLSDLQTMTVTMAGDAQQVTPAIIKTEKPKEEYTPEISFERKKDPVVTNVPVKKVEQSAGAFPIATTETSPVLTEPNTMSITPSSTTKPPDSVKAEPSVALEPTISTPASTSIATHTSTIKKIAEVQGSMGVYLTYVDGDEKLMDTIQVIIPVNATESTSTNQVFSVGTPPVTEAVNLKKDGDLQFLKMEINSSKKDSVNQLNPTTEQPSAIINSNCVNAATESDYNKLRRRIALQTNEDDKMNEAKKIFKNKCFTTSQVKGLSTLFLSDESRYKFFDVSYNFVSDVDQYSSLEKELIDPYYISRFKAMLRH